MLSWAPPPPVNVRGYHILHTYAGMYCWSDPKQKNTSSRDRTPPEYIISKSYRTRITHTHVSLCINHHHHVRRTAIFRRARGEQSQSLAVCGAYGHHACCVFKVCLATVHRMRPTSALQIISLQLTQRGGDVFAAMISYHPCEGPHMGLAKT